MNLNELKIMMNAEMTKINLEKCRHLDTNLFNEISKYKQNVERFLNFDEKIGNLDEYVELYFWLLHNQKIIISKLKNVLDKLYYDDRYAEKENVFLDDYVNPEELLEDINCIKKEIVIIGNYLIKEIHRKFKISLTNNKQIVNNFIKNNKIKVKSHTLNYDSCNIMTLFSVFSNSTDKYYKKTYINWVEEKENVLGNMFKNEIQKNLIMNSKTLDFKINSKILWGTKDLISYFENLLLINPKNYSDFNFYKEYDDIFEKILKLLSNGIFRVVFVSNNFENNEFLYMLSMKKSNVTLKNKFRYSKNFVIKFTSLDNLIAETRDTLFLENYSEDTELKNINLEYSKSIFIFKNMDWNDIIYKFKKNKISISSGMNNRKGMLSPLEYKFSKLLQLIYGDKIAYNLLKISNLFHKTIKKSENKLGKVVEVLPYKKPLNVNEYRFNLFDLIEENKQKEYDNYIDNLNLDDNNFEDSDYLTLMDDLYYDENHELLYKIDNNIPLISLTNDYERTISSPLSIEGKEEYLNNVELEKNKSSKINIFKSNNTYINNSSDIRGGYIKKYHTLINQRLHSKGCKYYSSSSISLSKKSYEIKNDNKSENEFIAFLEREGEDKSSTIKSNNLSKYMDNLRLLLNNKEMSWEDKQIQLEKDWLSYDKDLDLNDEKVRKQLLSKTSFSYYIVKAVETLKLKMDDGSIKKRFSKKNKKKKGETDLQLHTNEYYPYLNKIEILWMAVSIATTLYSRKNITWTNASSIIGGRILEYIWWDICDDPNFLNSDIVNKKKIIIDKEQLDSIKENYKKLYFKMKHFSYEDFLKFFSIENENIEAIKIGDFFLEMFSNVPHKLFERVPRMLYENNSERATWILSVKDEIFDEINRNLIPNNFTVPMVYKPLEWSDNKKGGQLLISKTSKYSIITGNNKEAHTTLNREKMYKTVNILNSLEFTVNSDLLDYLNTSEGKKFIELEEITMDKSEQIQFKYTWDLAKTFYKVKFYLTVKGDWRGRLYVTPFFLNYQGSEFNKSLVYMANGDKLNEKGYEKLCIYGATLFNEDNMSRKNDAQKLEWTKNNLEKICKIDFDFIQKAESKWLFLAFSLVMKKYKEDNNCIVYFPIYIDATCSGIQHVSAMIEDLDLARSVNLINEEDQDQAQDIYTDLLGPINAEIKRVGLTDENYPNLKFIVLTRKETKPGIMTKTYNVTLRGMVEQLIRVSSKKIWKKELDEKDKSEYSKLYIVLPYKGSEEEIHLSYKEIFKIAQIIEKNIFIKYNALEKVYNYFKDICKVMNSLNLPVSWVTPSGLVVTQHYLKTKETKYSFYFGGDTKSLILRENLNELEKRGQVNAIIPNIIHSLDASHLMNVVLSAKDKNINYVLPIHDCFGTHPNDVDRLFDLLKLEFVKLYANEEFLTKFHNNIKQSIKNNQGYFIKKKGVDKVTMPYLNKTYNFPAKPEYGELNLNDILDSKYMFI